MIQFISNYNNSIKEAECYIDINQKTSENNFQIVFLEPSIIFGDKKAIFSLHNYTLDYRFGFKDEELFEIVQFIKNNFNKILLVLESGIENFEKLNIEI